MDKIEKTRKRMWAGRRGVPTEILVKRG